MPEELKALIRQLHEDNAQLLKTWRRNIIVTVAAGLTLVLVLAGLGTYFLVSNSRATGTANRAIAEVGDQADNQARTLRCIENYENEVRDRMIALTEANRLRTNALDDEIHALNRVLRAALKHDRQRRILRLAERWRRLSIRYDHASRAYRAALRENPIPRLSRFRCAEQAARREAHSRSPEPHATATRTVTAPAPAPSTVRATVTVTAPPRRIPGPTRTVTRTVTVPPGRRHHR